MAVMELTEQNFEEKVLRSSEPVLVDFWAAWCGPCKMMAPIFEQVAGEVPEAAFGKVNVDEQAALAERFRVMSIPTLILFREGQEAGKLVGLQSKEVILDLITK